MTMSKQHFEMVARVILKMKSHLSIIEHGCLAIEFANELALLNPRFDRKRFLKACGVEE